MPYRLISEFASLFQGKPYKHRDSSQGDRVALQFYEDLVDLDRSAKLPSRVEELQQVVNAANRMHGIWSRRGDGTFGELVPGEQPTRVPGYRVARGTVATTEIGVEVKILAKAMIKQIDRVIGDLRKQIVEFRRGGGNPICIAVVGVNYAQYTVGYEGDRSYRTDGRSNRHPIQEAADAIARLRTHVASEYDEFLILPYLATNDEGFEFAWRDAAKSTTDYSSVLLRVSREYDRRF